MDERYEVYCLTDEHFYDSPSRISEPALKLASSPATEAQVEEAFAARRGTLIVIAHRISSALRADRVLVLDGTHVSWGTHAELMDDSPLYLDLVGHWA